MVQIVAKKAQQLKRKVAAKKAVSLCLKQRHLLKKIRRSNNSITIGILVLIIKNPRFLKLLGEENTPELLKE